MQHLTLGSAAYSSGLRGAVQRLARLEGAPALPFILVSKLGTLALIVVALLYLPFYEEQQQRNFLYPTQSDFAQRFTPWDASHYLHLSDAGYQPDQPSNAFAPLYPTLIKAAHAVVPDRIVAALLVSNIASGAALYLLFVYCKRRYGESAALRTLAVLLAFPTAFFLNLVYSEGVFLLLTMLFFWGLYTRNLPLAAVAAFLLPLTRLVGVAVVVPLAVYLLETGLSETRGMEARRRLRALLRPRLLYLLAPALGILVYGAYMQLATGDPLASVHAQASYLSHRDFSLLSDPLAIVEEFLAVDIAFHSDTGSLLDRAAFIAFLVSLPLAYRKLDKPLFVFALLMGLTPLAGSFMSYMRYLLVALPLFIAWGRWLEGNNQRLIFYGLLPLIFLQEAFVGLYAMYEGIA